MRTGADRYENESARRGDSLANVAEIVVGCLDAIAARSVAVVGADTGDLIRLLLGWAARAGARVSAIGPSPQPRLIELAERHPELEVIREPSREALRRLPLPDAVIIDGDPNYYTVSEELRAIDDKAPGSEIPLLLVHDVGWPHGRRDAYSAPEQIPDQHRRAVVKRPRLFPGEPDVVDEGLALRPSARGEGGPRNGVLTALEDFLDRRGDLRLAKLAPFFGFAVVWPRDAPWARAVADLVQPWDRNAVLERLEANRVFHLATAHSHAAELMRTGLALESQQDENAKLERLLQERDLEPAGQRPEAPEKEPVPSARDEDASATDAATIGWFQNLWFRRQPALKSKFLGIPTWQNPLDTWVTQEIVSEVRPDLIVETGTFRGGSAVLWAFLLEMTNPAGRVISIDVDADHASRVDELPIANRRVEFLHGSSTDPRIVGEVARRAAGRTVLAILDSDHSPEHVFGELTAYAPLIGVGSYIIVQDVLAGPAAAIERFLQQDDRFEPDRGRERFMITNCPGGFLRRVR